MDTALNPAPHPAPGLFEARYVAFLETIVHLRPSLHRYCARMTGSVLDGEDVVQDALFQAYRKLDTFDDARRLEPWLFRIAHNQCIDFIRRRRVRQRVEDEAGVGASESVAPIDPIDPPGVGVGRAIEHLVLALPPKERACVLLKDVFDYSLEEIAELVGSTVGGVKAALNRGRSKLATPSALPTAPAHGPAAARRKAVTARDRATARLLELYVERFNQRDWDGVRDLITADAQVRVADRFDGPLADAPYFRRYDRLPSAAWRLVPGHVDGEPAIIVLTRGADAWTPDAIVRVTLSDERIVRIEDYTHCPWVLSAASSVVVHTG